MNATQLLASCAPDALCGDVALVTYGPAIAVLFAIVLMLVGTWYRHRHPHGHRHAHLRIPRQDQ